MTGSLSTLWALGPAICLTIGWPPPAPPSAPLDDVDAEEVDENTDEDAEYPADEDEAEAPPPAPETVEVAEPEPPAEAEPVPAAATNEVDELDFEGRDDRAARDRRVGRSLRITGTVINGIGVGLLVGAGVLFVMRHRSVNDLDAAADDADPSKREGPVKEIEQREQLAITLAIAAGATLVVGTTLWVIGNQRARRAIRTRASLPSPAAGPGFAGVVWNGRF